MTNLFHLSASQLRSAARIKDKIADLGKELASVLGISASVSTPAKKPKKMSAAARAKISAAAKARWAKVRGVKPAVKTAAKKKRTMSAAGRAKIAAAAKARWATAKAAGKTSL